MAHGVVARGSQNPLLQTFDQVAVAFEDWEITVHNRIDQGIEQIRAGSANTSGATFKPLADVVEAVARTLPEGQNECRAENQRDLIGLERRTCDRHPQHRQDQVGIGIGMGSLIEMEQIGNGQIAQTAGPGDFRDPCMIPHPADIDPEQMAFARFGSGRVRRIAIGSVAVPGDGRLDRIPGRFDGHRRRANSARPPFVSAILNLAERGEQGVAVDGLFHFSSVFRRVFLVNSAGGGAA